MLHASSAPVDSMKHILYVVVLLFSLGSCKLTRTSAGSDFYAEDSSVNLYAFIGQKISVEELKRATSATETFVGINGDTVVQKVIYFD